LKGFRRVQLKPGERRIVRFTVSENDLAFYDQNMRFVTEPGEFQAWIAPDSASGSPVAFRLRGQ
jgi:beta-glucosidase